MLELGGLKWPTSALGPQSTLRCACHSSPPVRRYCGALTWSPPASRGIFPPKTGSSEELTYRLDELTGAYSHIHLAATYRDALGDTHQVDETIEIRDWWQTLQEAHVRLVREPAEESVKELGKMRKALDTRSLGM